jgi:hypothetical protein
MRPGDLWAGVLPGIIGAMIGAMAMVVPFLVERGCRRLWRWLITPRIGAEKPNQMQR